MCTVEGSCQQQIGRILEQLGVHDGLRHARITRRSARRGLGYPSSLITEGMGPAPRDFAGRYLVQSLGILLVTLSAEVDATGMPKPLIKFSYGAIERAMSGHSAAFLSDIWTAAGATDLWTFERAAHTIGTCRMGHDGSRPSSMIMAEASTSVIYGCATTQHFPVPWPQTRL